MIRNTLIFLWVAMFASEACATTGWDAYSVDIRGQYRIHGADCFNYIHKIGPEGRVLEPPLWTNYNLDGMHPEDHAYNLVRERALSGNSDFRSDDFATLALRFERLLRAGSDGRPLGPIQFDSASEFRNTARLAPVAVEQCQIRCRHFG